MDDWGEGVDDDAIMNIENLTHYLHTHACRGVTCSADGTLSEFHRRGVADLMTLLADTPALLQGALVADKVIGKGAALLMVYGGVSEVWADVISDSAAQVLQEAGIPCAFGQRVPYIINRQGDGMCPIEALMHDIDTPPEAYVAIRCFL